jgi:hypothetical protein
MGFTWTVAPTDVFPQMAEKYTQAIFLSGRRIAYEQMADGVEYAKTHAPWQDRTGAARAGLHGYVEESGPIGTIVISHDESLDYPIWLEVANQGRYSIIPETIDYLAPRVMRSLQNMINLGHAAR